MDLARRREIAEVARRADAWIVEDDPYSRLFDAPVPAVASLAPERTFYLATLSKCLSPGLRIAFLAPPEGPIAERMAESLRAIAQMPSPLMSAVRRRLDPRGRRRQDPGRGSDARPAPRRAIAAEVLPQARGAAEGIHVWLDLPPGWDPRARASRRAGKGALAGHCRDLRRLAGRSSPRPADLPGRPGQPHGPARRPGKRGGPADRRGVPGAGGGLSDPGAVVQASRNSLSGPGAPSVTILPSRAR